jgi:hypothetical protein
MFGEQKEAPPPLAGGGWGEGAPVTFPHPLPLTPSREGKGDY